MVAFLRPDPPSRPPHSLADPVPETRRHLRLVVDNTRSRESVPPAPVGGAGVGDEPGGTTGPPARFGPLVVFDRLVERLSDSPVLGPVVGSGPSVALATALIVGALLAVRVAQGEPPARDLSNIDPVRSAAVGADGTIAGAGDRVVVAHPGDSLWSIAERYAPDHDRRDAVDTLADINGGSAVQVGQQIVIPRELLD